MIAVTWDASAAAAEMERSADQFRVDVEQGFAQVGLKIAKEFQDNQLSGRTAGDIGLNIRRGTLRDSIKTITNIDKQKIESEIYNKGAQYWWYHQYKEGHNPKRLFFDEYFEGEGEKLYEAVVQDAVSRLAL